MILIILIILHFALREAPICWTCWQHFFYAFNKCIFQKSIMTFCTFLTLLFSKKSNIKEENVHYYFPSFAPHGSGNSFSFLRYLSVCRFAALSSCFALSMCHFQSHSSETLVLFLIDSFSSVEFTSLPLITLLLTLTDGGNSQPD